MKKINSSAQKGFSILSVILILVVIIAAIGIWALSGSTNTSGASSGGAKIQASSILNDSSSIKLAFDSLIINGTHKDSITYALDGSVNSMLTGMAAPTVSANSFKSDAFGSEGYFVHSKVVGLNITNDNNQHPVIMLAGLKNSVCEQLNSDLHGTTQIPVYASFTDARQFTAGATRDNPNTTAPVDFKSNGLGAGHITENWTQGCISGTNTTDSNLYFRKLN